MKNKKVVVYALIAAIIALCVGIGINLLGDHEHSFGEWETKSPATCQSAAVEVRKCECGEEETREGDPATGHNMQTMYDEQFHWTACNHEGCDEATDKAAHVAESISVASNIATPMATMTVQASDLSVTAVCSCGATFTVTDGIEIEGAALVLGENTVTVKCGEVSTTLTIEAAEVNTVLDGIVSDDTYISSGKEDDENSDKKEMGTKVDLYRIYFRVNINEILKNELFVANEDQAKVQLTLAITSGAVTDDTSFTLKAYTPAPGVTDVDFSKLTWNSVNNKDDAVGDYSGLHWSNGTVIVSGGAGHNVSADKNNITFMLDYSQIVDFVDENGNILLVFATNTDGLKVGSLENKTQTSHPAFQVVLNGEHFHIFDQKAAKGKYLISAKCGEKATYYKSCACGAAGTETFEYGGVINHAYGELIPKVEKTCTDDGVRAHYRCNKCHKYFVEEKGVLVATSAESLIIPAGHTYGKLMEQKDATCSTDGMKARYKCDKCKKFFDENKEETTEEALKIQKLGHTYGELIPQKDATCTEDGVKAHYRCTVCQKYFVEKDGQKVATSVESLKISAGHEYKLIQYQAPTCTKDGNNKYYKCDGCGKYFDADKNETTKEAQKIPAGHTYGELIPQKDATCTEDGMKAHYRCTVCQKYFVEKDGQKVATSVESLKISAGHKYVVIPASDPTCTKEGNYKYYKCSDCPKYFDAEKNETTKESQKIPALDHTAESISASYNIETPMATMVVKESDFTVTAVCACGANFSVTEGIQLEGETTLALGENMITVKYGELSTTLTINAEALNITLKGTIKDDTYVASSNQGSDFSGKDVMGTKSDLFRVYFRANVSNVLSNEHFIANKEKAKAQIVLAIAEGSVTDTTTYTLKAYAPAAGVTDIAFSALTWSGVSNTNIAWGNGKALNPSVSANDGKIILTLAYNDIEQYVGENGDILFAFATNTSGLKIASKENTSFAAPSFKVILKDDQ